VQQARDINHLREINNWWRFVGVAGNSWCTNVFAATARLTLMRLRFLGTVTAPNPCKQTIQLQCSA